MKLSGQVILRVRPQIQKKDVQLTIMIKIVVINAGRCGRCSFLAFTQMRMDTPCPEVMPVYGNGQLYFDAASLRMVEVLTTKERVLTTTSTLELNKLSERIDAVSDESKTVRRNVVTLLDRVLDNDEVWTGLYNFTDVHRRGLIFIYTDEFLNQAFQDILIETVVWPLPSLDLWPGALRAPT